MRLFYLITFSILSFSLFGQSQTNEQAATEYIINKYPNGKKEAEGKYINGKEHGKWTFWYQNGNLKQVANYNVGRLHGVVSYYYKNL